MGTRHTGNYSNVTQGVEGKIEQAHDVRDDEFKFAHCPRNSNLFMHCIQLRYVHAYKEAVHAFCYCCHKNNRVW